MPVAPTDVTLDGHSGTKVELSIPDDVRHGRHVTREISGPCASRHRTDYLTSAIDALLALAGTANDQSAACYKARPSWPGTLDHLGATAARSPRRTSGRRRS
jgi:hypothetical protein